MTIGLIAHDAKKKLMQNFCIAYRGILSKNTLYATGTTGRLIEEVANLNIHKYLAGHLGGMQQMAAQIEHNEMDLVIFLRDPQNPKSHEPDPLIDGVGQIYGMYVLTETNTTRSEFDRYGKAKKIEFSLTLERCDEDLRERLQSSSFSDMLSGFKDKVTSSLNSAASSVKGLF